MLAFDIESDGLLDELTTIHCIHVLDRKTGKRSRFNNGIYADGSPAPRDGSIEEGVEFLMTDDIGGHNIIGFDIPAIKKLYPKFKPRGVFDTLVSVRVIWPNITDLDFARLRSQKLPDVFRASGLIGSHALEAWGYRLGEYKGDFDPTNYLNPVTNEPHSWATIGFTQDMDSYGEQDVTVTDKLLALIESKNYSRECLNLEHDVASIIQRQVNYGFAFNEEAAYELMAALQKRRAELEHQLIQTFHSWYAPDGKNKGHFIPKRSNKNAGYTEGAPLSKVKLVQFNPGSRDHIANRLTTLFGWQPSEFTEGGKPKIDETTLDGLTYPEARLLKEFLTVEKRLGQIGEGDQAWLKKVKNGRIHGSVNTNGAVTGRMTHSNPNVAQVPKVGTSYGAECRALFQHSLGILVGCDAEGLELRMLAHYMARYDDGEYVNTVVNGKKEDGTDVHSVNKRIAEFNKRDNAKTLIYAFLYGAGDYKLGTIVLDDFTDDKRVRFNAKYPEGAARDAAIARLGTTVRGKFMKGLPALKKLVDAVKKAAKEKGYVKGLDGRLIHVRSGHAALNTLLQGAGATVMKRALQLLDAELIARGYRNTSALYENNEATFDYEFVANIHDEFQTDTKEDIAQDIGKLAANAIKRAGETFRLRCPLSGAYEVGKNWKETH